MPSSPSSSDDLVKVASTQTEMEAEMIQGLLADHGIPSMLKKPFGFGAYYAMLGAGPHHVLVPAEAAERAREVLEGMPGEA